MSIQSLKSTRPGWINLAVGEPQFLWEFYGGGLWESGVSSFGYPGLEPETKLLRALKDLHPDPNNHFVVANGARHALYAAIHALITTHDRPRALVVPTPFWPGYKTIGDVTRALVCERHHTVDAISIATVPNNPDGKGSYKYVDIVDCAYYSDIYNSTSLKLPEHQISVWSASKLYGWAGARVGWLVTRDRDLADAAAQYVEDTTSGVCVAAQKAIAEVIDEDAYSTRRRAREVLVANRTLLTRQLAGAITDTTNTDARGFGIGMYAWVKIDDPESWNRALTRAKVAVAPGPMFGGAQDYCRISLGLDKKTFARAVTRIEKGLDP